MTAAELATELEVSVRTIYRDLAALGTAGVPVYAEAGPGGGCQLLEGYRSPFSGLSAEEATALLVLGVPEPLRAIGLEPSLSDAQRRVRAAAGLSGAAATPLVHLDMPRWFHSREPVPHLTTVAEALLHHLKLVISYQRGDAGARRRTIDPLGVVNKAGIWYVVAATAIDRNTVFRVGRIVSASVLDEHFARPEGFDLVTYWDAWSADFEASRDRISVSVRASPAAWGALPEVFGDAVAAAIASAEPPDADGWRTLTLSFEHENAAAYRLSGFGDLIEVVSPTTVRERVIATAQATLRRHGVRDGIVT